MPIFPVLLFFFLASYASEQEIQSLESQIEKLEKSIMQKEMRSQGQMFEEWHQYAETLEQAQQEENQLKLLHERLKELKQNE